MKGTWNARCSSCSVALQRMWKRVVSLVVYKKGKNSFVFQCRSGSMNSIDGSGNGGVTLKVHESIGNGNGCQIMRRSKSQNGINRISSSSLAIAIIFFGIGFIGYFLLQLVFSVLKLTEEVYDPSNPRSSSPNVLASIFVSDPQFAVLMMARSLVSSRFRQSTYCKYANEVHHFCYARGVKNGVVGLIGNAQHRQI